MSVKFINLVWEKADYKGEKLLALLALADYCNDDGECWPSYEQIADKARVTTRGAIGIIKSLIEDNAIQRLQTGTGRGSRNRYKLIAKNWKRKNLNKLHRSCKTVETEDSTSFSESHSLNETANSEWGSLNPEAEKSERGSIKRVNVEAEKGERGCKNDETYIELNHHVNHHSKPSRENLSLADQAYEIYRKFFDRELGVYQQEQLAEVQDLAIWRDTLRDWKLDGYSERMFSKMLRSYGENVLRQSSYRERLNGNGHVGAYRPEAKPLEKPVETVHCSEPLPAQPDWFTDFKREVEARISPEAFATWFAPLHFVATEGTEITVRVPDRVFEHWLLNNYRDVIEEALDAVGVGACSFVFQVAGESNAEEEVEVAGVARA